ncbi:MAG TPA: hypothetical protein VMW27_27280, partial [Thermoanaerobaculia bacterium]|nr:hypothetical protein [Thermoanaerobaculia bacterium]
MKLVEPNSEARRLDPMAFFAALKDRGGAAKLTPSHEGHALLSLLTLSTLIEIRDEYDRPFDGPVEIQVNGHSSTAIKPPIGSRGTFVMPAGTATIDYKVIIHNHVLTPLPSGVSATASPSRSMKAPSHWALQAIFMTQSPSSSEESSSWFVPNLSPFDRYTEGNQVIPLRDGIAVFREFAQAMKPANFDGSGHFIFLAGWKMVG